MIWKNSFILALLSFFLAIFAVEFIGSIETILLPTQIFIGLFYFVGQKIKINNHRNFEFLYRYGLLTLISLFILKMALNMINVYQLENKDWVNNFCTVNLSACEAVVGYFYKLKIYRFITLTNLFFLVPIITLLMIDVNIGTDRKIIKNLIFKSLLVTLLSGNLIITFNSLVANTVHGVIVRDQSYENRFVYKEGGVSYYGWIKVYADFIKSQVDETSILVLPPQTVNYKMEGNIYYFRWFLYPRELIHIEDLNKNEQARIFIVISEGECPNNDCVWPNFEISKSEISKIILIDRKTQKVTIDELSAYSPEDFYGKWGLIELIQESN